MDAAGKLLVAGSTLSQIGNFVNVTAVMVILQQRHGSALMVLYFLLRTVVPFLLSRPLVAIVPAHLAGAAWAVAQALLATLMFVLAGFSGQVPLLLVLLAIAGVPQSSSSAWMMQIAESADPEHRNVIITALSTSIGVALVAGPALGGLLAAIGGLHLVFIFDSASFAASCLLVPWWSVSKVIQKETREGLKRTVAAMARAFDLRHGGMSEPAFLNLTMLWISFGLFGGFLTACETPIFRDLKGFSAGQIGAAIGAYGFGGLVVFAASTFFGFNSRRLVTSAVMVAGTLAWLFVGGWAVYATFFVIGLGYALFDSAAQVALGESFARQSSQVSQSWAWVNQLSLLTSVVSFLTALVYFSATRSLGPIATVMALFAILCVVLGVRADGMLRRKRSSA